MNLITALNTGVSGMKVGQIGINTTAHNISNVNTPGYVRQRVEQTASRPLGQAGLGVNSIGAGQQGTGVTANAIIRIKNSFYDYQYRSEVPSYGNTVTKYNYFNNMETIFNEPSDTSISSALAGFFNGFNELTKDPNSTGAKNIAIENARYLANSLNKVQNSLNNLKGESLREQDELLASINDEIEQLTEVTKQIAIAQNAGNNPNDLMDRRDLLIDSLGSKIDLTHPDIKDILKDGVLTLDEVRANDLDGALKGVLEMQDTIDSYSDRVGTLMTAIADSINGVYKGVFTNGAGADTRNFFNLKVDGGKVVGIEVNADFIDDPSSLVMTSKKALELMGLKDVEVTIDGKATSIVNYYTDIVQDLGHATQNIIKLEKNQSKLLNSIDTARWNVAGVSQDEELVNLVQYQHAYNASAKVVSTVDSLLDVVINGLIR